MYNISFEVMFENHFDVNIFAPIMSLLQGVQFGTMTVIDLVIDGMFVLLLHTLYCPSFVLSMIGMFVLLLHTLLYCPSFQNIFTLVTF